jgi:hypothetical protein
MNILNSTWHRFTDRLEDLEGTCHEREFAYWPKSSTVRRK